MDRAQINGAYDLLAAGELNADIVIGGLESAPEFGKEVSAASYFECLGSSTAICACTASDLGLKTAFFGMLGTDPRGELVLNAIRSHGVDASGIIVDSRLTTGVTVSVSTNKDRALITYSGDTIDGYTADKIPLETYRARHLHVGAYALRRRLWEGLPALFRRAHKLGMTISLDAGWDESGTFLCALMETLKETDIFFPNEIEAARIARTDDFKEAAAKIASMGCDAVIKLGEKGAVVCKGNSRKPIFHGAYRADARDTTGAGDNFNSGYLYAYLNGKDPKTCLLYANAAGAISTTHYGGASFAQSLRDVETTIAEGVVPVNVYARESI
ncbi:MAG: carbohydrate kinase family protein [Bacillota bacterium]